MALSVEPAIGEVNWVAATEIENKRIQTLNRPAKWSAKAGIKACFNIFKKNLESSKIP